MSGTHLGFLLVGNALLHRTICSPWVTISKLQLYLKPPVAFVLSSGRRAIAYATTAADGINTTNRSSLPAKTSSKNAPTTRVQPAFDLILIASSLCHGLVRQPAGDGATWAVCAGG